MITPPMWIGFVFGAVALFYCLGWIFVHGRDWPPIHHYTPRHRRNHVHTHRTH